jgi:hypothetical protein
VIKSGIAKLEQINHQTVQVPKRGYIEERRREYRRIKLRIVNIS